MDDQTVAVVDVRSVGPDAVAIDLETPPGFAAEPGQFVTVSLDLTDHLERATIADLAADGALDEVADVESIDPDEPIEVSRFYTVSSPHVGDTFEITVELDPEGAMASALAELEAGDEVVLEGPYGSDYYEGEDPIVVLAGGPGIGPAVGVAERAVEVGAGVAVVYRDETPIHTDRLEALADASGESDGTPSAHVTILDGDASLEAPVADALAALDGDAQAFVYGFADFVDDATAALAAAGGDTGAAKIENFG